jgi:hypothetical protein
MGDIGCPGLVLIPGAPVGLYSQGLRLLQDGHGAEALDLLVEAKRDGDEALHTAVGPDGRSRSSQGLSPFTPLHTGR